MKIGTMTKAILFVMFSPLSLGASYYDQPITGEVESIEINSTFTSKRNIIVTLKSSTGALKLCGGSSFTGYVKKSDNDETFNAFLSVLLLAKATKDEVLVLTADGSEGCRIDLVRLN